MQLSSLPRGAKCWPHKSLARFPMPVRTCYTPYYIKCFETIGQHYLSLNSVINKCGLKWSLNKHGISTFTIYNVNQLLIIWKYFLKLIWNLHLCFNSAYLWFPHNLPEMELEQANNFIKAVKALLMLLFFGEEMYLDVIFAKMLFQITASNIAAICPLTV